MNLLKSCTLFAFLLLTACGKPSHTAYKGAPPGGGNGGGGGLGGPTDPVDPNEPLNFEMVKAQVLETNRCLNCHTPGSGEDLTTYESIMALNLVVPGKPNESKLLEVMANGSMPKGGPVVSADHLAVLTRWIDEGAKKELDPKPEPPVTFDMVKTQVLDAHCTRCHREGGRLNDLSSFEAIMAQNKLVVPGKPNESQILEVIVTGVMPPRGAVVPQEAKDLLAKWIAQGATK